MKLYMVKNRPDHYPAWATFSSLEKAKKYAINDGDKIYIAKLTLAGKVVHTLVKE